MHSTELLCVSGLTEKFASFLFKNVSLKSMIHSGKQLLTNYFTTSSINHLYVELIKFNKLYWPNTRFESHTHCVCHKKHTYDSLFYLYCNFTYVDKKAVE